MEQGIAAWRVGAAILHAHARNPDGSNTMEHKTLRRRFSHVAARRSPKAATLLIHRKAAAQNTSKAAIINLIRSLALEWGERGVRVNGISPGALRTELMATRLADPEYVRKSLERMAIKRIGQVEDVVGAALFPPACSWITG